MTQLSLGQVRPRAERDAPVSGVLELGGVELSELLDQIRLTVEVHGVLLRRLGADPNHAAALGLRSEVAWLTPSQSLFQLPDSIGGLRRIEDQLSDFANCARLAKIAGYDGVEIIA